MSLKSLLNPKSIAVVGVSAQPNKLGSVVLRNIVDAGFQGPIYPVNPKYDKILGLQCYSSVTKIPGEVDVVMVVVPAEFVLDVVKDCAKKGVKNLVIITAGFKEIGAAGAAAEIEIRSIAKKSGMRILGPNCLGFSVSDSKINATFAALAPHHGNIAFISQSGAFNSALLDLAEERKLGFSHFISLGNKMDINEIELLEEFLQDPKVKVIGMYIEQFADGRDMIDLISRNQKKPIVVLHPGETEASQKAMSSHTGSLAGSSAAVRAALTKVGVVQVDSFEKLFNAMWLLSTDIKPQGRNVAIVTNAGGPGVMLSDMLVNAGMSMAKLSPDSEKALAKVLPPAANVHNPVDLIGDALADRYAAALDIVLADENVDIVLTVVTPQLVTQIEETAKVIFERSKSTNAKLIVPLFMGGEYVRSGVERLDLAGIPAFEFPEQAVAAISVLTRFVEMSVDNRVRLKVHAGIPKFKSQVAKHTKHQIVSLPQDLVYQLAQEVSLDLPKQRLIFSMDQALGFVAEAKFPVVLKAKSEDILHKTDVKALYLNINAVDQLHNAITDLSETVSKETGSKNVELLIQEQLIGGEEVLIGVQRDGMSDVYLPQGLGFGHILAFGKGGIYTELYKDVAFGLVPLTKLEIEKMMDSTKFSKVIRGFRGKSPLAVDKVIHTLEAIQKLVQMYPEIQSIDINPAILTSKRCVVVDMKILVQK